jgi:O-antigen ligase
VTLHQPFFAAIFPFILVVGYIIARNPGAAFVAFASCLVVLQLKSVADKTSISIVEIVMGMLILYIMGLYFVKIKVIGINALTRNKYYLIFLLFFAWTALVGVLNVFSGQHSFEDWGRDFLLWSPLLVMPVLYQLYKRDAAYNYKHEFVFLIILWVCIFVAAVIKIRSSLSQISFLFQLGRASFDITNAAFMIYLFLAVSCIEKYRKKLIWFLLALGISFVGLILTFNRTTWISVILFTFIMLFLMPKTERRIGFKHFMIFLSLFAVLGVVLFLTVPFVHIGVLYFWQKFQSAGMVTTDASFLNRLHEWEIVLNRIWESPLLGYGLGGMYNLYEWLVGFSHLTGYTHNAYLGILFKSGLIGFILIATAYIGILRTAFLLLKHTNVSQLEKAMLRACIATLLMMLLNANTVNIFAHREIMFYIGMIWGFVMYVDQKSKSEAVQSIG